MENDNLNFDVISLNAYTSPKVIEDKSKEWVSYKIKKDKKTITKGDASFGNTGTEQLYYDYLDERYNNSPTLQALIDQISKMIYGKGLDALDSNKKPEQFAAMLQLLKKKEIKRMVHDRKKYGFGALQIQYKNKEISRVSHIQSNKLLSGKKNENNEVDFWYYSDDWNNSKLEPKAIPVFNTTNNTKTEVLIIAPYSSGDDYYSLPDYSGALGYAYLEERISEYLINDTDNGFSGTKVVNFNNGILNANKRREVKNRVINKLTGSTGEKVIVSFNNSGENATTVENFPLDNAPEHYRYLSEECETKLLKANKAPAWLIGSNNGGQGLASNADEIKNQMLVFDNFVIKSYQEEILDALEELLAVNGINLKLYFKTLQPLEFTDVEGMDAETKEEETGIKQEEQLCKVHLSKDYDELKDLEIAKELIDKGEDLECEGWELIHSETVDYDTEDDKDNFILEANEQYKKKKKAKTVLSKIVNLVSTGTARPSATSEQDYTDDTDALYKVRYTYNPETVGANSRAFCKAMVRAGKQYRKEDIVALDDKVVNAGFGVNGSDTYSIWLYKGGALCGHTWKRNTYRFTGKDKKDGDTRSPKAKKVAGKNVGNEKEVATKPKDMKYNGFYSAESRKRVLGY